MKLMTLATAAGLAMAFALGPVATGHAIAADKTAKALKDTGKSEADADIQKAKAARNNFV